MDGLSSEEREERRQAQANAELARQRQAYENNPYADITKKDPVVGVFPGETPAGKSPTGASPTVNKVPVIPSYEQANQQLTNIKTLNPALAQQMNQSEYLRAAREVDLARGQARGEQTFGGGSLGRVSETVSPEMQAILARRQAMATGRGGAATDYRESVLRDSNMANQMAQRQLRASQAGVGGPLAAAQQARLAQQQGRATNQLIQDTRAKSLGEYQSALGQSQADILARQQYNIAQQNKEALGRFTAQYGEAGLGVAERTGAMNMEAAKSYAAAASQQAGGGKK